MENAAVEFDPFRQGEIERIAPSTEPQREILTSAFLGREANIAFNEGISLRVAGRIDPDTIERALHTIVDRHEALRTTFTRVGDELCVNGKNDFSLQRFDRSSLGAQEQEAFIQALWKNAASTPLNLHDGPLFRAIWVQLGQDLGELVIVAHHVICDGWSFHVILQELSGLCGGTKAADLDTPPSFAEFAERQMAQEVSNADVDYWRKQFETLPPVMDLPTDGLRPMYRSFTATRIDHEFSPGLVKALTSAAGKLRASVVSVVLAGTAVLLNRLTENSDLVVGLPVARQATEGLDSLVGHAVQLLPIRLQLPPGDTFGALVGRSKSAILDASEHPKFTFGSLIRDLGLSGNASRVPLVPVIFNIDQAFGDLQLGDAVATMRTVPRLAENFEIFFNILPSKDKLVVEATFNTDLFSSGTMKDWLVALENLLLDAVANPDKAVDHLSLSAPLPDAYARFNSTERQRSFGTWLTRLAECAAAHPGKEALIDGKQAVTYSELVQRSDRLAALLVRRGVKAGSIVGLYMARSVDLLVALIAVHKAGAAYVPLDPLFPEQRLAYMVENSGACLLVADLDLPLALSQLGVDTLKFQESGKDGDVAAATLPQVGAQDLAYVIYTSGSTGKPKGVEVTHGCVANFVDSMASHPGFGPNDVLLAVTTLSFDISVLELLLPLTQGGRVVIATREEAGDARKLAILLDRHHATMMQATPSTWRLLLGDSWPGIATLTALCGGEPLPADLSEALLPKVRALWNMYGPTETTVWSTCQQVMPGDKQITVGRPIHNTTVYVMDGRGEPLGSGLPGEIWIGGQGVARGYHDRPDLTAERFVTHPRLGRMYRTGDRGRLLNRGVIEHLGRLDDQVKVRGFRIELAEIEACIGEHPDIQQAAVHLWTVKPGDVRIVACCIPKQAGDVKAIELRKHLRARLPEYMIPQYFLAIDKIPLTPNNKIARRELPVPAVAEVRINKHEAPVGATEAAIADIWARLVRPARPVGRTDRFFEIGGHSLLGLEVLRQIEEKFGVRLNPHVLFNENLADIAKRSEGESAGRSRGAVDKPVPLEPGAEILVTENQERIYREWQQEPGHLRHNAPISFRLRGPVDPDGVFASVRAVFVRHSALRTVLRQGESGVVQQVQPVDEMFRPELIDLTGAADPANQAVALLTEQVLKPFNLETGPIVRTMLVKLGPEAYQFFIMPHQVLFDGWSIDIVFGEMFRNYEMLEKGASLDTSMPKLAYGDFASWQRKHESGDAQGGLLGYWKDALKTAPALIQWPGGTGARAGIERVEFSIPRATMDRYEKFCNEQKIRPQTLLLAAFGHAVCAALGRSDLLIDVASSGRFIPEAASLVGQFFRNLPLRLRMASLKDSGALLQYVHTASQEATDNQAVSLSQLAKIAEMGGSAGRINPQIAFSYQESRNRLTAMGRLQLEEVSISRAELEHDIEFWTRNTTGGLLASVDYRNGIVPRELMEVFRNDLLQMLDKLARGPSETIEGIVKARIPVTNAPEEAAADHAKKGLFQWVKNKIG